MIYSSASVGVSSSSIVEGTFSFLSKTTFTFPDPNLNDVEAVVGLTRGVKWYHVGKCASLPA